MDPGDRVHPLQALAVYAEPLAVGRRVVVFADPRTGLRERFEALDADGVVLVAPDDDLDELKPGARFDLALVADLGLFPDPEDLLARVRRLVGEGGVALIAAASEQEAASPGARVFDYYALFDLVAREFADVRMIAQLPFYGLALAEVGDEEDAPAVSVDTQLADADRTPAAFVAVASQRGASLDPYAIVELPADAGATAEDVPLAREPIPPPVPSARDVAALDAAVTELAAERLRTHALAAQLESLQEHVVRAAELERELSARARQLADLSSEVEEMRSAADAGRVAAAQVEELGLRAARAEKAYAQVEPEIMRLAEAHAAEHAAFESALRDRAQTVRSLEAEVTRRERMIHDLVGALEEQARRPHPLDEAPTAVEDGSFGTSTREALAALTDENAQLREALDRLALELARREGDAQATQWRVAELERRLAGGPPSSSKASTVPPVAADGKLAAALDELDALRQALAQEHAARARVESGEELERARAEIQRQATLLEQLGQKGEASVGPAETAEELR